MDTGVVVSANLSQLVPELIAFLGALGWFALRARHQSEPRLSRWWGALAGLAAQAVPSVMGQVAVYVGLEGARPGQYLPLVMSSLPTAVIWLLLSLGVLLICVRQREDPLRRSFAAAVLAGVVLREGLLLVLLSVALLFSLVSY